VNYLTHILDISFAHYQEMQDRQKKTVSSNTTDRRPSTPTLIPDCAPTSPQDELVAKALEIINLARKGVQDELDNLQGSCRNLKEEVKAVTARRDLMGLDLGREREWIRLLELTLKSNAIPFPPYPFK
jgi:hypothetical protein